MSILLRVISPTISCDLHRRHNKRQVTFISVFPTTTVQDACQQALEAFGLKITSSCDDGDNNINNTCCYSLVIESGRTRIYNPYYSAEDEVLQQQQQKSVELSAPIACIEVGQLSMPLDPSWMLLPYILMKDDGNHHPNSNDEENVFHPSSTWSSSAAQKIIKNNNNNLVAPWSVVAYLVKEEINSDDEKKNNIINRPMMLRKFSQVNRQAVPRVPDGRFFREIILKETAKRDSDNDDDESKNNDGAENDVVANIIAEANKSRNSDDEMMMMNDENNSDDDREKNKNDDMSMARLLPLRLQNLTNSLKPCAYTE